MIAGKDDAEVIDFDWGRLEWICSAALGNSETMTFGRCTIKPGMANPRHRHPNCDEILHVVAGRIIHTLGSDEFPMGPGDTISIPTGVAHNARSVGDVDAVMLISFSSADRRSEPAE